jgi:transitional endoplasmic reticulum ATPase
MAAAKSAAPQSGEDILRSIIGGIDKAKDAQIWGKIDTEIKHEGKQIVLPADPTNMSYDAAIDALERIKADENQEYDCNELVAGAPWDSLVAVFRAMQKIYGVVSPQSMKTFFGEIRPDFVSVRTGPRERDVIMVPMGQMSIPNVSSPIMVQLDRQGCRVIGTVKKRDRARLVEIVDMAKEIVRTESVYKSKSIKITVDDKGQLVLTQQPEFIDLSDVSEDDVVHNRDVEELVRVNVFSPLKNTAACRKHKIPLKRGILMSGPYGTGKSLTARVTAKVANDNDWTFIMLNRSLGLKAALQLARLYQPCVIFAEDVDRTADRSEESVNDLVNTLDGVDTKSNEIMVVLTTNYIEHIDKSLLRPGRFDAVITLANPDAEAAQRLVRKYAGVLLPHDADLAPVGETVAGISPAAIREVVERAKLAMLADDRAGLTADDLRIAGNGMRQHLDLLKAPVPDLGPKELLWQGMLGAFRDVIVDYESVDNSPHFDEVNKGLKRVLDAVGMTTHLTKAAGAAAQGANEKAAQLLAAKR